MNVQDLVATLDEGNANAFFTVEFTKKDGSHRVMNCRRGVKKHLKGGTLAYKPADYNLLSVWDVDAAKGGNNGYRMISVDSISRLSANGNTYGVKGGELITL